MSLLAHTIKSLMEKCGLNESQLSRKTGIGQPVIHRMASGHTTNPKIETLRPIAHFFGINIDQLIGDEPIHSQKNALRSIPLLKINGTIEWPTQHHMPHHVTSHLSIDMPTAPNAFAIILKDATMQPRFPEHTLVILEPTSIASNNDFVLAQLKSSGIVTFKQLIMDGTQKLLKPLNRDFNITPMHDNDTIIGKLIQARINPTQEHQH